MIYVCRLSINTVCSEITFHNLLALKRDQFIALFVGPCWQYNFKWVIP